MKLKSLKFGKNKEEVEETIIEEPDAPIVPEADLAPEPAAEAGEIPVAPHGPLSELTLDAGPAINDSDEAIDFGAIEGGPEDADNEEDITVVEVKAGEVAATKGEAVVSALDDSGAEDEAEPEVDLSDSLSSLFSEEEEEANPLATLIESLPDVTAQELMDDIQEIKEIIQEWRHH